MPVLNIRNLPDEVHRRLRMRAARASRSMEAEARAILTKACRDEAGAKHATALPGWVTRLYGRRKPARVVEKLIAERRKEATRE